LNRWVLPVSVLGGVFAVLTRAASRPLSNFDTYFHLRFGAEFLEGDWRLRDPGSVTSFGTADWVPTQWLPEMVMAKFEAWFGLAGVAWLSGLLFLALALIVYTVARRRSDPIVAVAVMTLTLVACRTGLSMRPQILSYILVALTASAWLAARDSRRPPWILIPATYLWAMCHGMWPVGLVIGAAAVSGMVLDRDMGRRLLVRMALVPVLSLAVATLTPVGPGLLGAVLSVNSRAEYYTEWSPPDFTDYNGVALLALIAITAVLCLRAGSTDWFTIVMLALTMGWAVYSLRTVPVAASMIVPFAATALQGRVGERLSWRGGEITVIVGAFITALAVLAVSVSHTASKPLDQPAWLDSTLAGLPRGTPVLNESGFGGYLMWRYPQLDLVSHGYGDVYTDAELRRNSDIETVQAGWDELVRGLDVSYAVVDPRFPLGYALLQQGWRVIRTGEKVAILEPPG
jgi:hypothetical protein